MYRWLTLLFFQVGPISAAGAALPVTEPRVCIEDRFALQRWTLEDGLPDSQVCGVVSGHDGDLWLATARNLVRFDGRSFTSIGTPPQAALGINEGLLQDRDGGLWVYGYHGAVRYADGSWWQSEEAGLPRGRVRAMAEGDDGELFLACERSVYQWDGGRFRKVVDDSQFDGEAGAVHHLAWVPGSGLWIALGDRLFRWSPGSVAFPVEASSIHSEWVLHCNRNDELLAHGSFVSLRRQGETWERLPESRIVAARCLLDDSGGTLWVGHDAGMLGLVDGEWLELGRSPLFETIKVNALAEDHEGSIWAGTSDGLIRLRPKIFEQVGWRNGAPELLVSTLWVESNNRVWAGLASGGMATGDASGLEPVTLPAKLANSSPTALFRERSGRIWCGTAGGELWVLEGDSATQVGGIRAEAPRLLVGTNGQPEWIATRRGVLGLSHDRSAVEDIGWPVDPVLSLWQDHDRGLWIGHESMGLGVMHPGMRIEMFPPEQLPGNTIHALYRDSEGILWIGGRTGLARWDGNRRFLFGQGQGLWCENVRQIAEDASGALWLGTSEGILRIDKRDLTEVAEGRREHLGARVFGKEAGMENEECLGGVAFPSLNPPRDRLWFPTRGGLLTLDTRWLPPPRQAPDVRLVGLETGNLVNIQSAPDWVPAVVDDEAGPRHIVIDFTALDFATPDMVRFRYTLTGPVEERSGFIRDRRVSLTRLPPGSYSFHVTACNGDGVWHPTGATVKWVALPRLWERLGFRVAVGSAAAALLAAMVWWIERRRSRQRVQAMEQDRAIENERARIARDLHDDIGAKLTRISLLGTMAAEDAGHGLSSVHAINELSAAARETHRAFDEIVWSVNPRDDTLRSLAHFVCKHAEEFFDSTPVACRCRVPEEFPDLSLPPRHRHHVFLAVKECLQNVLKHAGATLVEVNIRLAPGKLQLEISDDGCGFDAERETGDRGNGLRNLRERMDRVGGSVFIESVLDSGTRLIFTIPVEGLKPAGPPPNAGKQKDHESHRNVR
jgi:signal transduction histidine kinase/ligand-binding sensor domain-containing protein